MNDIVVIVHNIRSTHNVGSILRTADAMGVSCVYMTGYTPTPRDRFGRSVAGIQKTALGAELSVPWKHTTLQTALRNAKKQDYTIIALEQDTRSIPLQEYVPSTRVALLVGNEVRGVSKQLRDASDIIIEIPMHGSKESLNVSVATGIALYALRNSKPR